VCPNDLATKNLVFWSFYNSRFHANPHENTTAEFLLVRRDRSQVHRRPCPGRNIYRISTGNFYRPHLLLPRANQQMLETEKDNNGRHEIPRISREIEALCLCVDKNVENGVKERGEQVFLCNFAPVDFFLCRTNEKLANSNVEDAKTGLFLLQL
jgi:hypothetical protein